MVKRKADSQPTLEVETARTSIGFESTEPATRSTEGVTTDWPSGSRSPLKAIDHGEATSAGHVAEGKALDHGPFWVLLGQVGYEVWWRYRYQTR